VPRRKREGKLKVGGVSEIKGLMARGFIAKNQAAAHAVWGIDGPRRFNTAFLCLPSFQQGSRVIFQSRECSSWHWYHFFTFIERNKN
jgi:hypothetical protein